MKKREYITIDKERLNRLFQHDKKKPSERFLRGVLNGDKLGQSEPAKELRKRILAGGGKLTYDGVTSEEVFFDSDGNFIQRFSNGAQITISKATGKAVLTRGGRVKVEVEHIKISEIAALQKAAREL